MASSIDGWDHFRELKDALKHDWATLWKTKFDDEVIAEGVSSQDFERLFVDRGEILFATKDFKPVSFKEILEKHVGSDVAGKVDPDPRVGGWRKFARENFPVSKHVQKRERPVTKFDLSQTQRKNGRGWLNKAKMLKKAKMNETYY